MRYGRGIVSGLSDWSIMGRQTTGIMGYRIRLRTAIMHPWIDRDKTSPQAYPGRYLTANKPN
jgi:hypothetical protein